MLAAVLCLLVPKSQTLDTIHIGTYPSQDLTDTLLDNTLVRKDGETPLFDGQGSERTVTNSSQTVTGTLTQDGCGNTVATTGSSANPYMYAATSGYRNDGDAGLMHVGARYYDAQVGRFTSRDTELDEHPYLYCDHDPVNYTDSDGHQKNKGKGKVPKQSPGKPTPYPFPDTPIVRVGGGVDGGIGVEIPHIGKGDVKISLKVDGDVNLKNYWPYIPPARQKGIDTIPKLIIDWYHGRVVGDWPTMRVK